MEEWPITVGILAPKAGMRLIPYLSPAALISQLAGTVRGEERHATHFQSRQPESSGGEGPRGGGTLFRNVPGAKVGKCHRLLAVGT